MSSNTIAIIGASGGIGNAFVELLSQNPQNTLHTFSRSSTNYATPHNNIIHEHIDYYSEDSISQAAKSTEVSGPLDLVLIATGFLHNDSIMPERSLRDLSLEKFEKNFLINTIGPALIAKHFLPRLNTKQRSIFAALSARVGSISDNRLGGWYAYRASKAALNMLIKTASIEVARKHKQTIVVGLHPGTVNSRLSQPFQNSVRPEKLFSAQYSAKKLMGVIYNLCCEDTGKIFAWDGQHIDP